MGRPGSEAPGATTGPGDRLMRTSSGGMPGAETVGCWKPWTPADRAISAGKEFADGILYALLTAGCFGWLWPR